MVSEAEPPVQTEKEPRVPAGRRTEVRNRGTMLLQRPSRARLSGACFPVVALRSTTG